MAELARSFAEYQLAVQSKGEAACPFAGWRNGKPALPNGHRSMDVCLLSCARNCGHHLREWFTYHRAVGVTAFYIVDHRPSEDDTSRIIQEFADVVLVKTGVFKESDWFLQLCALATQDGAAVLFANDTDEFLCGNGAPLAQRIRETLAGAKKPARHLLTPGFNMVPLEDGSDWTKQIYARPNKLWTGKSALYIPRGGHVKVVAGGQHNVQTMPRVLIETCPKRTRNDIVFPLPPDLFPIYYLHFTFHGSGAYLRRIRTMMLTPENARQMAARYGKGIVDEERRIKGNFDHEDLRKLSSFVEQETPEAVELYKQAVRSSLISASEVRSEVACFFGKATGTEQWDASVHKEALRCWGLSEDRLKEDINFPKKTRAEDLM